MIRRKRRCRPFSFNGRICPVSRKPGQGAGFGGCRNSLFACFYDDDKLLHLLLKGSAALTKHDSTYYLSDADGEYQSYTTDKPAWIGGRYVDEGNVYATDSSGDLLDPPPEMVSQPAFENLNSRSHILSGWSGIATVTGITGLHADFAGSRVEDTSTTAAEYKTRSVSRTAPLGVYSEKFYINKESSVNGNTGLVLRFGSATIEYHIISFNASTGGYLIVSDDTGTLRVSITEKHNRYIVLLEATASDTTNTDILIMVAPCQYTTDTTTVDSALTGSVDVLNSELYEGKKIEQVENAGAIFTDGAIGSTDALNPEFSSSLLDNNSFAMAFNVRPDGAGLVAGCFLGYGMGAELFTNDTFTDWTSDNPDHWTVTAEDANNYITEHSEGARLVSDQSTTINFKQSVTTTVGNEYLLLFRKNNHVSGFVNWRAIGSGGWLHTGNTSGSDKNGVFTGQFTSDQASMSVYVYRSDSVNTNYVYNMISCRELNATNNPEFRLIDAANNSISVSGAAGEMNKVGVVFNKTEGKMKLYVNDNSAEGPYSGEFHDGILDWFRDSLFPGGLYGYKIWSNCDWDEQNENVTNWLSDLNKAFDDGFDDGFS